MSHVTRVIVVSFLLESSQLELFIVHSQQLHCETWIVWRAHGFKFLLIQLKLVVLITSVVNGRVGNFPGTHIYALQCCADES